MYQFSKYESEQRTAAGEHNDCTVRAISAACSVDYNTAHALLASAGRKPRKGFYFQSYMDSQRAILGWTVQRVDMSPAYNRATLAQTLPLYKTGRYVVVTRGHAFAYVDGTVIDTFKTGARSRVWRLYRITAPVAAPIDAADEAQRRELRLRIEALEALLRA